MAGGRMLISADDGDADLDEPDNLYIADLRDGKSCATVLPFRMMYDFRRAGEIEGLTVDPATDDLLVLANRGARGSCWGCRGNSIRVTTGRFTRFTSTKK